MTVDQALKVRDVAKALHVHPETARRMLADGRLRGFRVGNRWRLTHEALAAYVEASAENETRTAP